MRKGHKRRKTRRGLKMLNHLFTFGALWKTDLWANSALAVCASRTSHTVQFLRTFNCCQSIRLIDAIRCVLCCISQRFPFYTRFRIPSPSITRMIRKNAQKNGGKQCPRRMEERRKNRVTRKRERREDSKSRKTRKSGKREKTRNSRKRRIMRESQKSRKTRRKHFIQLEKKIKKIRNQTMFTRKHLPRRDFALAWFYLKAAGMSYSPQKWTRGRYQNLMNACGSFRSKTESIAITVAYVAPTPLICTHQVWVKNLFAIKS